MSARTYYNTCQYCNCNLDPGEICSCAHMAASRKLERIIAREGDADGFRRTAAYFDQLLREAIREQAAEYMEGKCLNGGNKRVHPVS
jgi:hypothetical protein